MIKSTNVSIRKTSRRTYDKTRKMLRELGIHLEDVSSQNNELIER